MLLVAAASEPWPDARAALPLLLLLMLFLCRKSFYRLSFFCAADWRHLMLIAVVISAAVRIALIARGLSVSLDEPWWALALGADAPLSMRASMAASMTALMLALGLWMRPSPLLADAPAAESASSDASLALLGDKRFFMSGNCPGAIMYAAAGAFWIAMGDPIGRDKCARDLIWHFCEEADRRGAKPVFYEAGERWLDVYRDNGLRILPIGEEARVDLTALPEELSGGAWKGLRAIRRRVSGEGWGFYILEGDDLRAAMPRLRVISDEWLRSVRGSEKGFSLGFFDERYLAHFPVAVVKMGADISAFCNLRMGAAPEEGPREISVDLMRHASQAPEGAMSFLFLEAMLWAKSLGFGCFSLGMSPLSNMNPDGSLWERAGGFLYRHGEKLYNFRGVRGYKEKFHPEWVPRYLVHPGAVNLPLLLTHLAHLIS